MIVKIVFILILNLSFLFSNGCRDSSHNKLNSSYSPIKATVSPVEIRNENIYDSVWLPATFEGIKLGISNVETVRELWGSPIWEGDTEEKVFSKDNEEEKLLEYKNIANVTGQVSVTIGKKTNLVKAIAIYPDSPPTLQEVVSEYGEDYIRRNADQGICSNERNPENKNLTPDKVKYPIFLVYPSKGIYISINDSGKVNHFGYLVKCPS